MTRTEQAEEMYEAYDAYMEDFETVVSSMVDSVLALADRHGIDRDDAMRHMATTFSALAEFGTFKLYQRKKKEREDA